MTSTVLEMTTPAPALPHTQDLPREVLACLLHRELLRLAAALDSIPDLEKAEVIQIPAGTAYRLMALGTAALKAISTIRPTGSC